MSQEQWVDLGLYAGYILLGIALVAAVVMNLINTLKDPRSLIKSAIGIGALAIIYFISLSIAPSEFGASTTLAFDNINVDPTSEEAAVTYKRVGAAMTTTFILIVLAVVGLVYSSVARLFN